ncbi:MAG: hypothetical protein CMH81_01720 [Nitrospiraceae bacterium]|jgi:hypothetical protein|nr:hypothetical protein [Nitrospiraceae bacterium]|tara:strand:+ start:2479 stop:2763 length:285 start_codon:yes stop_codon:yes gene_type:complete
MRSIVEQEPNKILTILSEIALRGKGATTECLLDEVLDAGLTAPTYFQAEGEDSDASYLGQSPAWAKYHIREWKRVVTVYKGGQSEWRLQTTETP